MGCSGMCGDVALNLDGHELVVDLFVLPLRGANIVLDAQWLATLGPVIMDYKELTLSFNWDATSLTLKGPPSTTSGANSIASIGKVDVCGFH
ncbi:hypothetical protein Pint_19820 [Pistacia integerrima]|uniref:Uncharacterized protein n=1 Tax=Pistacia integerrima TaxID=434235 RepID=A0ACC0XE47_9ROSI|nr:hypothetical protein Pint_19820 [Pistacia integerrima]